MKIKIPQNSAYDICLYNDTIQVYVDLYIVKAKIKRKELLWGLDPKDILNYYMESRDV